MKEYLLAAAGVIFLSVIVSLLVPEGKLNRTITFIMRLVCIAVLISPALKLFKFDKATQSDFAIDYEFVEEVYSDQQSEQLEKLLLRDLGCESECLVEVVYSGGEFKVDGVKVVLSENCKGSVSEVYEYLTELKYQNISVT